MPKSKNISHLQTTYEDVADEVKQYLELSNNSSGILKYMSDAAQETPESDTPISNAIESLNKSSNFQDGRAPSPASISSLASNRRLEWDSGADVGYEPSNTVHPTLLSTLERMALDGCTESLIRTDPEGTNSCLSNRRNPLHKLVITTDSPAVQHVKCASISVSSPREVAGVINLSVYTNNEAVSLKSVCSKTSPEGGSRKNSAAVAERDASELSAPLNVDGEKDCEPQPSDGYRLFHSPVDDNLLSEKSVPLVPLASTVAANSASSSSLASTIVPHNTSDALPPNSNVATGVEKVITRGIQVGGTLKNGVCSSETSSVKIYSGSEEEIRGLTVNDCPPDLSKDHKVSQKTGRESLDTSSFDCAHSFEYFPGEVFDKDSVKRKMKSAIKINDTGPEMKGHRINSSLSKDLERNIGQIRDILNQKKTNNKERKVLIKHLVERIVGSEYLDDDDKDSSEKSSVRGGNSSPKGRGRNVNPKMASQENIDVSEKSFVPYRPVPGGRLYHVASQSTAKKDCSSSSSFCDSDDNRPITYYLPVDRVRITRQSSVSSEKGSSPPICANCLEKKNSEQKYISRMRKIATQKSLAPTFVSETKCDVEEEKPCCSRECHSKGNWWGPGTKSEWKRNVSADLRSRRNPLLTYVDHERANQLHWIKNEIKHLTDLAQLLEDCSVIKSDSPASLEEQTSVLSSVNKKDVKNVANASDKFLSSARSSPAEEPITATMRWHNRLPKKKPLGPLTPPMHDTSEGMHLPEQGGCNHSGSQSQSHSFPSRSSSRNLTNSDISDQSKGHEHKFGGKHPEAYVITFEEGSPGERDKSPRLSTRKPLKEVRLKVPEKSGKKVKEAFSTHCWTSLEDQLKVHNPQFVKSAEERQKCLEELARLRSLRQMTRRKLLHCTLSAWEGQLNCKQSMQQNVPKSRPGFSEAVIKPSSKVKEKTQQPCPRYKRRHRVLPETQKKEAEHIKKQSLQTNRIMADIFSRRLQKKVLNGAVSLSNSVSVISSL